MLIKIHVINWINKKVYKIILMVIFTWALLFRLVCRVIINLKGGKICIFNHIYILQIVKVWSCLQNILTAQKRKCQTQKVWDSYNMFCWLEYYVIFVPAVCIQEKKYDIAKLLVFLQAWLSSHSSFDLERNLIRGILSKVWWMTL